jgi:4-amino-4-deoxy-L-arabinose transferase-like glycosyltransferase
LETVSPAPATAARQAGPESKLPGRVRRALRASWPLIALAVAGALIAVLVRHLVFPAYSWNRDEPVYLWQMRMLREGKVLVTDGGAPSFFYPWLAGHTGSSFFSQYTPGWPLVLLAFDVVFGSPGNALVFGTVLAIVATYAFTRALTGDHVLALVASAVMTVSPFLVIQSGTYLGYLFTYGLGLLFGAGLIAGARRAGHWLLIGAGLCLGWIFMTRPYDALLWAAAFGGYLLFSCWHERERLWRAVGWSVVGFVPLFVATLVFNYRVTGSFTQFPITAADPLDTFGLGVRRIMPQWPPFVYTLRQAVKGLGRNSVYLPIFLFGSYLGVVVAAVGLWLRRRDRTTVALLALAVVFPLGYFVFWGLYLSSTTVTLSGPIYFMPLFATLSILIATVLVAAWRRRRALGVGLVVVLVVATVPFLVNRLDVNHRLSALQQPWQHVTDGIDRPVLVFVSRSGRYLMHLNPFSANSPDIDGPVVYATDHGPANLDLIAARRGRSPYLENWTLGPDDLDPVSPNAARPRVTLVPLHVVRGTTMTFRVEITVPRASRVVVAYATVGTHTEARTLATDAPAGATYSITFVVTDDSPAPPGSLPFAAPRLGVVEVGAGAGADPGAALAPGHLAQRFWYRRQGSAIEMATPGQTLVAQAVGAPTVRTAPPARTLSVTAAVAG